MASLSKKELRTYIKSYFKGRSNEELKHKSQLVLTRLEQLPEFSSSRVVALFHPLPDEVDTIPIIYRWAQTKIILLPLIVGDDIIFRPFEGTDSLSKGSYSISEPAFGEDLSSLAELVVTPGLAFDLQGGRLGRGKGYYDRFFARRPDVFKVGICYDFQIIKSCPREEHDFCMDVVIFG